MSSTALSVIPCVCRNNLMTDCKCEDVTLYDEGHRCKRCFAKFISEEVMDEKLQLLEQKHLDQCSACDKSAVPEQLPVTLPVTSQQVCWRNHKNIVCNCDICKKTRAELIVDEIQDEEDQMEYERTVL